MCGGSDDAVGFPELLRDPLIRLVMASGGVTEQEMINLMNQLRRTPTVRERPADGSFRAASQPDLTRSVLAPVVNGRLITSIG